MSDFAACLSSPGRHQQRPGIPGQQDPRAFSPVQDNSHTNQNDYSSDILLKMKGAHPQVAARREAASPSKMMTEVATDGHSGPGQDGRAHFQPALVPTVSAFKM